MAASIHPGGLPQELLRVPDEEKKRQAVDSLRGYVYQVYQTLLAWLDLNVDETLLLEIAEDYAMMGIYLTQVLGNGPYMLWSSVARVAVPPTSDL